MFLRHLLLLIAVATFTAAGAAKAGDFAFEQIIGFSKDGRYFGFEEYGEQAGSGYAYAHVFVIDLETDTFAPGTPVRVSAKKDSTTIAAIRWEAKKKARDILRKYKLNNPGIVAHARGLGDFSGTDRGLTSPLLSRVVVPKGGDPTKRAETYFDLIMTHIPAKSVSKCPLQTLGFQLERVEISGKRRFIHRDEKILKSRGCPLKYRISRVYLPYGGKGDYAAVLISVFQTGFEGPNRRFIVFPVEINL